jgi:hypothetical protein
MRVFAFAFAMRMIILCLGGRWSGGIIVIISRSSCFGGWLTLWRFSATRTGG